jgi:hypothetical protein
MAMKTSLRFALFPAFGALAGLAIALWIQYRVGEEARRATHEEEARRATHEEEARRATREEGPSERGSATQGVARGHRGGGAPVRASRSDDQDTDDDDDDDVTESAETFYALAGRSRGFLASHTFGAPATRDDRDAFEISGAILKFHFEHGSENSVNAFLDKIKDNAVRSGVRMLFAISEIQNASDLKRLATRRTDPRRMGPAVKEGDARAQVEPSIEGRRKVALENSVGCRRILGVSRILSNAPGDTSHSTWN